MTDIEWTPESVVALVALVLWALGLDYETVGSRLKKAGCAALVGVTLGLWHPCKPPETVWVCHIGVNEAPTCELNPDDVSSLRLELDVATDHSGD